jgi:predicted nucleic acid-binding protein
MSQMKLAKRLVVIADVAIKGKILARCVELGAKGYHAVVVLGQGEHEQTADMITGAALIRIELVTNAEVAEAIMDYLHSGEFKHYALTAYVDNVEVDSRDNFV